MSILLSLEHQLAGCTFGHLIVNSDLPCPCLYVMFSNVTLYQTRCNGEKESLVATQTHIFYIVKTLYT